MKIKHLLEYADASTEDFLSEEVIESVKKNSSKFINEFLKKGLFIYRGNDDLPYDEMHVIPTMSYREAHGNIFYNDLFQTSLERYLKDHNIPSRYQYAVSTIAFDPSDFDGVGVDDWYYFIPKGNYRYHYYSNVTNGDINVNNESLNRLAKVSYEIDRVYDYAIGLEYQKEYIFNNVDKIFHERGEEFVSKLFTLIDKIRDILSHPMEMVQKDIILLDRIVAEADDLLDVHPSEEADSMAQGTYRDVFDLFSRLRHTLETDDLFTPIDTFRKSIVVDEITDSIKRSEIVFQCKEYYIVPMSDDGEEFIRRLLQ